MDGEETCGFLRPDLLSHMVGPHPCFGTCCGVYRLTRVHTQKSSSRSPSYPHLISSIFSILATSRGCPVVLFYAFNCHSPDWLSKLGNFSYASCLFTWCCFKVPTQPISLIMFLANLVLTERCSLFMQYITLFSLYVTTTFFKALRDIFTLWMWCFNEHVSYRYLYFGLWRDLNYTSRPELQSPLFSPSVSWMYAVQLPTSCIFPSCTCG